MSDERLEHVRWECHDGTGWITINRPEKLNALNRRAVEEIVGATEHALSDAAVRVIVVTGAGEKAFVAGADIRELAALSPAEAQAFAAFLQASLDRLERSCKPVIAAVNGLALGGGAELAMACHVRIAADSARFGQPEIHLGLIPGAGGTQRLQRIVGRGRALDLLLGGDPIDAAEAWRIGLVSRVVPGAELRAVVQDYARQLAAKSPLALARLLESVLSGGDLALDAALRLEAALFGLCFATDDMREGTRAFLEKRRPCFTGR